MDMVQRPPVVRLYQGEVCADFFAGGGGTSTGIEMAIGRSPDVAINHDKQALAMHSKNHPDTVHIPTDVFEVDPVKATGGKPCAFAWFSPDCTFFSKASGGKPFRDPSKARRVRGLAWVVVKWAEAPEAVRPRVIFVENVEEFQKWGALGKNGRPDPLKQGCNFTRWVGRLRKAGYQVEWLERRASDYGAPTSRKRLFVIARRDGKPIVWPVPTHGPKTARPYRTAAECIDFTLPVPSIFLTQEQAKAWARENGCGAPKRPLAEATLRRIARGIERYVLGNAQPFLVPVRHQGSDDRVNSVHEPMRTIPASDREVALVVPFLTEHANASNQRNLAVDEPMRTLCANVKGGHFALVAPTLIQTGYGERHGQRPRSLDLHQPLGTAVGGGVKHALVAAFLAKHNGGHEATGQMLLEPAHTITTQDQKALVVSHLTKLYGTSQHGASIDDPMPTVTANGNHIAEVRAFLVKYYGNEKEGRPIQLPLDTIVTKDRFALVTVTIAGEEYVIADIGMRMLTPRELFIAQGFPRDYHIEEGIDEFDAPMKFTKKTQTRLVGNSVPPHLAAALIGANLPDELRVEAIA